MVRKDLYPPPDEMEMRTPLKRQRYLERKLRRMVRLAYEKAPAVKQIFDRAGVAPTQVRTIRDLERLPVLPRADLPKWQQQNPPFGGFATIPASEMGWIGVHPGPQFEPPWPPTRDSYKVVARENKRLGVRKGDIVISTQSHHLVLAGAVNDAAYRHLGCTVIPTGPGNTDLQVEVMYRMKPTVFMGSPRFLYSILKRAEELGYNPREDFALRQTLWVGERSPDLRMAIEEDYGIHTVEAYGFAPLGSVARECGERNGLHFNPQDCIIEVVDPGTGKQLGPGEEGEVVVTWFSDIFPLIRYGSGDLSLYDDGPCPCGRTSPRLVKILGRTGEGVKARGMFVVPGEVRLVAAEFPAFSRFQVAVNRDPTTKRDEIRARVELANESVDRCGLAETLKTRFKDICRLKMDEVKFLPAGTIPEDAKILVDERPSEA